MPSEQEELQAKIEKYRRMSQEIGDSVTAERIQELISELEDQLKGLAAHPERDNK